MNEKDIQLIKELVYHTDKNHVVSQLRNIDSSLLFHCFAANYNWNNGFDIPKTILDNDACDFGTGLLMFYHADGYRMLVDREEFENSSLKEWKNFLQALYDKLIAKDFNSEDISFEPELTRIQLFKLKKSNCPDFITAESPGYPVDVPKL